MAVQRVLVVEDDEALRAILVRELRRVFEVVAIADPREAVIVLRNGDEQLAAVVTGYKMHPIDGVAMLAVAREYKPGAARLLVTGALEEAELDEAAAIGTVHRVIHKPWPPGRLAAIVLSLIDSLAPG